MRADYGKLAFEHALTLSPIPTSARRGSVADLADGGQDADQRLRRLLRIGADRAHGDLLAAARADLPDREDALRVRLRAGPAGRDQLHGRGEPGRRHRQRAGRHWIIGTTDTDWSLTKEHPAASSRDTDYLLDPVNAVLNSPLTREDVEGVYAGLRPLLTGESESTSKLSRDHVVGHPVPGLVVLADGK